jgi:4-amino-4-deoxy-L-arabinose transferase-like glycosyltransferase
MMEPDEGIILQAAQRVLNGEVAYRDFFSFYTPGSFYFLAAIFKIFGSSILVARTALAATGAALSVLTYLIARRACTRTWALVTAGLVTLTSVAFRFLVLHNWDSTLWASLAVYSALRWQETATRRWAAAMGTFCAVTVLFEQSKGAGLLLGLLVGFLLVRVVSGSSQGHLVASPDPIAAFAGPVAPPALVPKLGEASKLERSPCRTQWLAAAVGFALPVLFTLAWFASRHALDPMLADWVWPLHHYSQANRVPYGYQNWSESSRAATFGGPSGIQTFLAILVVTPCFLVPVLPIVALGILANVSFRSLRQGINDEKTAYYILVTSSLAGLLVSVVTVRADILHIMYLAPLFYLVLAWILDGRDLRSGLFRALQPALRVCVLAVFGLLAAVLLIRSIGTKINIATRRGTVSVPARDTVLDYTLAHVAPGSKVLIYPYLPLYYYLTDTYSPAPFDYIQPGMHTADQVAELQHSLASDRTRIVIFEYPFYEKIANSWSNTPIEAIGRDPMVDYIESQYRACSVLHSAMGWRFLFMIRKDLACPP